jgi:hypothetical protein
VNEQREREKYKTNHRRSVRSLAPGDSETKVWQPSGYGKGKMMIFFAENGMSIAHQSPQKYNYMVDFHISAHVFRGQTLKRRLTENSTARGDSFSEKSLLRGINTTHWH